ncbi:MAG TPA: GNAT family N-acetyltransferase [Thermoplasmata archaeon]|nr:GNAT family N-acetyltransferase [Thermoplasmata archaeon]
MAEVQVRRLTAADVPWAIALTDTESWGYTARDFERLLYLEPEGVFLAEADGARVGITACTTYGRLAYIGAVIVDARWRGKHVGDALMRACLAFLDGRGIASARLNAYLNVIPFYERLGFRQEFLNYRYSGQSEGRAAPGVRLARTDDLAAMAELDRRFFGADRTRLLRRLLDEFSATSLVFDDKGEVVGHAFGNTGGGSCEIGPFVCDPARPTAVAALLDAMLAAANAPSSFTIPAPNAKGLEIATHVGFRETFRTMRMVRGSHDFGGDPRGVFGLAGLEKG